MLEVLILKVLAATDLLTYIVQYRAIKYQKRTPLHDFSIPQRPKTFPCVAPIRLDPRPSHREPSSARSSGFPYVKACPEGAHIPVGLTAPDGVARDRSHRGDWLPQQRPGASPVEFRRVLSTAARVVETHKMEQNERRVGVKGMGGLVSVIWAPQVSNLTLFFTNQE